MRIVQVLPTLNFGDAVGNNSLAIDKILKEAGIDASIYAENIDPRLSGRDVRPFSEMPILDKRDILLYHLAIAFGRNLTRYRGRVMFQYHNITPPSFFEKYDSFTTRACEAGLAEMRSYKNMPMLCWADSDFNRQDLIEAGYICPIHTIPILVPFEDYEKPADEKVLEKYNDDYVNFIFVGRVVPNKAHEDVIRTFAWYQKHVNSKCRLFLVGNADMQSYVGRLKRFIMEAGVRNVIFPGHISFNAILAYYRLADIFLCMSQHEGFCVPLLEAMFFKIPIIARKTTAIPFTLGGAGALVEDNDPVKAALLADKIIRNKQLKESIIAGQNHRLQDFSYDKIKKQIVEEIHAIS